MSGTAQQYRISAHSPAGLPSLADYPLGTGLPSLVQAANPGLTAGHSCKHAQARRQALGRLCGVALVVLLLVLAPSRGLAAESTIGGPVGQTSLVTGEAGSSHTLSDQPDDNGIAGNADSGLGGSGSSGGSAPPGGSAGADPHCTGTGCRDFETDDSDESAASGEGGPEAGGGGPESGTASSSSGASPTAPGSPAAAESAGNAAGDKPSPFSGGTPPKPVPPQYKTVTPSKSKSTGAAKPTPATPGKPAPAQVPANAAAPAPAGNPPPAGSSSNSKGTPGAGVASSSSSAASSASAPPATAASPPALAPGASRGQDSANGLSSTTSGALTLVVGKSLVIDSSARIQRVSIANGELAEAVAVSPFELLVNGKGPGQTTLIVWQEGERRRVFDLSVVPDTSKAVVLREELRRELPAEDISVNVENEKVLLRGRVSDLQSAQRALMLAQSFGETVNLLHVNVPDSEPQILLKVRFANVDRTHSRELGVNLLSTGALNTLGGITTGQFRPPRADFQGDRVEFSLSDALNIFLFRPDLDLGATIRALQAQRVLQILAEPNLLAMNGKKASFLAGGEFPFPVLQGGLSNAITIQFREFGIRLTFTPVITPRGTIRLIVTPEVSALDFANAFTIQGFTIPALSTRRVETEIELENGQSFAIAGLLDNRMTENFNKVPGIGDIPVLGKLFQSKSVSRNDSELLVVVTPEMVRPAPQGMDLNLDMPEPFLRPGATPPRHPGEAVTGAANPPAKAKTVPYEVLVPPAKSGRQASAAASPGMVPVVPGLPAGSSPAAGGDPAPRTDP